MLRLSLPLALAALLLAACSADRTAIMVEVTSPDLAVPDDVDALRFEAVSEFGGRIDQQFDIAGQWPHSLSIVPPEGERMGSLTITVTGFRGGELVVRSVVTATFLPGATRPVTVTLSSECRGVVCPDGVDCRAGRCIGEELDGGTPDAGSDAGMIDAGMIDAGTIDAGTIDAGRDAGMIDAGRDAGMPDTGPPDAGCTSGPTPGLVINEVDYDQPGADAAEFIELINRSASAISLCSLQIILVNGSSVPSPTYGTVALDGMLGPGQYLVVAPAALAGVPPSARRVLLTTAIQNGNPDGVALWDAARGALVDSISYGGEITMASIDGMTVSLVAGTATAARDSTTAVRTICRAPNASDTGNDAVDWATCDTPTPGAANAL
ncbi:MAG: lamin tail domain-containing protein [Myxococcota bacterium]|nr:lamin tail domain-containing protein [Myxococcota bacterium]